jgi:hypothetical protein
VPAHLVGCALIARLFATRIELFHGAEHVATHPRQFGRNVRVIVPEHFEPVFAHKPRARVMVYRDWLVGLSVRAAEYIAQVCRKRYAEMDAQMVALYQLAQQLGREGFLTALEVAHEQQTFGVEYVQAIATRRRPAPSPASTPAEVLARFPETASQRLVERELQVYEQYVANAAALSGLSLAGAI